MTVKHHLSDDLILAYGTGELDEATSLLVATHMALCPRCRAALEMTEAMGGVALESMPEAELDESEVDGLLARIEDLVAPPPPAPARKPVRPPVLPQPLRDYVGGDVDDIRWRGFGKGVRQLLVATGSSGAKARLLWIPAGAKVPEHSHGGLELTLVLDGSFYDQNAWFRRGDVEEVDANVEHQPIAGPEKPCICLAVTDAPLRFRSLLPRLAQPFLGI